jgi:hypothetical protein
MSDKGPIKKIKELARQASLEVDLAVASHNAEVFRHKIEELEDKLAEAVVALADVYRLHLRRGPAWDHEPTKKIMDHARATLEKLSGVSCANLKGQDDE